MEKCHLVAARGVASSPWLRFFELGAPIETVSRFVAPLQLSGMFADGLLEMDVLACITQPVCKTGPLADQGLVADFNGGCAGDLVGCQQAHCNEGINDLLQQARLASLRQGELRESRSTARSVLFRGPWVDQAHKERTRQLAMLFRGQGAIGPSSFPCHHSFYPTQPAIR